MRPSGYSPGRTNAIFFIVKRISFFYKTPIKLIGVSETPHTTHDAKDIVVGGVDAYLAGAAGLDGVRRQGQLKGGRIDSTHIAGAGGLVLFRFETEGVDVNLIGHLGGAAARCS